MKRFIAAFIALISIMSLNTTAVSAASPDETDETITVVRDAPIFARGGIRTLPKDVQDAIRNGDAVVAPMHLKEPTDTDSDEVRAQSVVSGNCGSVFFWIRNNAPGTINLSWGFLGHCFAATNYRWNYNVTGPGYSRADAGGGTLLGRREVTKTYSGKRGRTGLYSGCAQVTAQRPFQTSVGTACDSFRIRS